MTDNTLYFNGSEIELNNSMLLFLGSGIIDEKEFALWSLVVFEGEKINDSEHSKVYLDIEFATPLQYNDNGNIKLLDAQSELFFSKVHHLRIGGESQQVENQETGTIQILEISKEANKVHFKSVVVVENSLLEVSYNGITKLIVMN